jgi:hypothetical protein
MKAHFTVGGTMLLPQTMPTRQSAFDYDKKAVRRQSAIVGNARE